MTPPRPLEDSLNAGERVAHFLRGFQGSVVESKVA